MFIFTHSPAHTNTLTHTHTHTDTPNKLVFFSQLITLSKMKCRRLDSLKETTVELLAQCVSGGSDSLQPPSPSPSSSQSWSSHNSIMNVSLPKLEAQAVMIQLLDEFLPDYRVTPETVDSIKKR